MEKAGRDIPLFFLPGRSAPEIRVGGGRGARRVWGARHFRRDICRVVAREKTGRKESDVQPLVEGLESAAPQWRAA